MSAHAERVFLPLLRELESHLTVPIPARVRILRELEFDLEELRRRLEAEGLSRESARARALEILAPDAATVHELERLHTPAYLRLTRDVRGDVLRIAERGALAISAGIVLVIEATLLSGVDVLRAPSSFIWPVLALGALLFAAVVAKAFELWVRRDHRSPERGLAAILALSVSTALTGLAGAFVELYRLVERLEASVGPANVLALEWLVRSSGLLAVAVLLAMTGALAWFLMAHWLALVTGTRAALLGIDRPTGGLTHSTTG
jgi:hypothetical protein